MTEQNQVPARSRRVRKLVLGFAAVCILLVTFLALSHTNTFKLATTHQPDRFTELYFTNPTSLPATVKLSATVPVSFTLHNEEARTQSYTYNITFADATGTTTVLKTQEIILQNGQKQVINQDITLPTGNSRGEVSVNLLNKSQSVHFWLERK
jgi:uncharacterized membrane protein